MARRMALDAARKKLSTVLRKLARANYRELAQQKKWGGSHWRRKDFIWDGLLLGFSTMGGMPTTTLLEDAGLYEQVCYNALARIGPTRRLRRLRHALVTAGIRWPNRKSVMLARNLDRIEAMGGPSEEKKRLQACRGREEKIGFLKSFCGIGDKYARDILMDAYHPDFRDSIAVDQRLQSVSRTLNLRFTDYRQAEEFYLSVGRAAGLTGWETDRVLFKFQKDILPLLKKS